MTFKGNDAYNTPIGGFFSILINIMIYTYMILNLITMFTPGAGDFLGNVIESINVDDQGEIKMSDLHLKQFVAVRKQGQKGAQLMIDDDFNSHLDVSFALMTSDWYKSVADGRFTETTFPARQCTLDDFGTEKGNSKELFAAWNGITILCPEIPKD